MFHELTGSIAGATRQVKRQVSSFHPSYLFAPGMGFTHVSPAISLGVEDYFRKFNITDTQGPN